MKKFALSLNITAKNEEAFQLQLPQVDVQVGSKLCPCGCCYHGSCGPHRTHVQVLVLGCLLCDLVLSFFFFFLVLKTDVELEHIGILTAFLPPLVSSC